MPEAHKVDPTTTITAGADPAEPTSSVDRFCAEILAGRHTMHLVQILEAVHHQLLDGPSAKRWKIDLTFLGDDYAGRTITEDDFSLNEAYEAERISGHSWAGLDPLLSAADCRAVIAAHLVVTDRMAPQAAVEFVGSHGFNKAASAIGVYEVLDDPKGEPTSSGATTTS